MPHPPGNKVDRLLLVVLGVYLIFVVTRLSPSIHAQSIQTQGVSFLPAVLYFIPSSTPTAAPGRVLISEVLYNHPTQGENGEWIELYNPGDFAFDLSGHKLGDEEEQFDGEGMYVFPNGTILSPKQVMVVASKAAVFRSLYGFPPAFELNNTDLSVPELPHYAAWSDGLLGLANEGDEVIILDSADHYADALVWGNGSPFFYPTVPKVAIGSSLERYPPFQDSDTAQDWREQHAPSPGSVDLTPPTPTSTFTPTATNTATPANSPTPTPTQTDTPTPTLIPALVINEIHADPHSFLGDANGDLIVDVHDDEFIEIINATGATVDLSGWRLRDDNDLRHIFPKGTLLVDGCAVIVFGGGNPIGSFGGSIVQTASTGSLELNNEGDRVSLLNPSLAVVAAVGYGPEASYNQSLTRNPDITGSEPLEQHASIAESGEALFSPGRRLDGLPFSGCNPTSK